MYDNCILLAKRIHSWKGEPVPFGGYWSVFAGTIEDNENALSCAVRELKEEAQITAPSESLEYIKTFKADRGDFVLYIYEADRLIIPTLNEEHTEYGWFKINSLRTLTEKIDPKIIECIELYETGPSFRKSER